jgi:hypothetical protein
MEQIRKRRILFLNGGDIEVSLAQHLTGIDERRIQDDPRDFEESETPGLERIQSPIFLSVRKFISIRANTIL